MERLAAEHPGIEIIPVGSSTYNPTRFNEPLIIDCDRFEPTLKAEWKQGEWQAPPMKGYKNLSPHRVARRRAKNKAARKARNRNRR